MLNELARLKEKVERDCKAQEFEAARTTDIYNLEQKRARLGDVCSLRLEILESIDLHEPIESQREKLTKEYNEKLISLKKLFIDIYEEQFSNSYRPNVFDLGQIVTLDDAKREHYIKIFAELTLPNEENEWGSFNLCDVTADDLPKLKEELQKIKQFCVDQNAFFQNIRGDVNGVYSENSSNMQADLEEVCTNVNERIKYCLHECCLFGEREDLENIIANGSHTSFFRRNLNLNKPHDGSGNYPLHTVLERDDIKDVALVKPLLAGGAQWWRKNRYGYDALHMAAQKNRPKAFKLIWEKIKKTDYKRLKSTAEYGRTILHSCSYHGLHDCMEFLPDSIVKEIINVQTTDKQEATALHNAAMQGHAGTVNWLLQKDADPNIKNFHKETALTVAAIYQHKAVIQCFVERGIKPSEDEMTQLKTRKGFDSSILELFQESQHPTLR